VRQVRGMLQDIATLDTACHTATNRLSSLRSASRAPRPEEQILVGHIHEIQKEKAILTSNLPTLIRYERFHNLKIIQLSSELTYVEQWRGGVDFD
jgi:hypothetical protein